jgi:hypothetical protein
MERKVCNGLASRCRLADHGVTSEARSTGVTPLFALIRVHSRLVLSTLPEKFLEFAQLGQGLAGVD